MIYYEIKVHKIHKYYTNDMIIMHKFCKKMKWTKIIIEMTIELLKQNTQHNLNKLK